MSTPSPRCPASTCCSSGRPTFASTLTARRTSSIRIRRRRGAPSTRIVAAAKKAGKIAGIYCATTPSARVEMAKRGFRFCAVGSDIGFLRAGYAAAQVEGG